MTLRTGQVVSLLLSGLCWLPVHPRILPIHPLPPASDTLLGRPDVVTVVPFKSYGPDQILVHAAVDGWEGDYVLDTGAPVVSFNCLVVHTPGEPSACHPSGPVKAGAGGYGVQEWFHVHTVRIGTLSAPLDKGRYRGNALLTNHPAFALIQEKTKQPCYGSLGLNTLAPFETIIDYLHQRLIVIRLDSAGHRIAPVPAYTPKETVPLVLMETGHYGIPAHVGNLQITHIIDTGGGEMVPSDDISKWGTHLKKTQGGEYVLDRLSIGSRTVDTLQFSPVDQEDGLFGPGLLRRLGGVVGFNFRSRQLALYR